MKSDSDQKEKYNRLYSDKKYIDYGVPDYKITNGVNLTNKKIIVLGAGTARDTKYLVHENEVWAVDYSSQAIKVLRKFGIKAYKYDLDKPLKLKSNYFDIVVAKDILEHLQDPSILAKEIHRILKPTGYAVINVPNHFFLPMRIRILLGKNLVWKTICHNHTKEFEEWNYMHKIFFTWNGFKKFLKLHGLRLTRTFFDFGTLSHYSQPEMAISLLEQQKKSKPETILINTLKFFWKSFNIIFPRSLRSTIVKISPSLLCASFYVWCRPVKK